MIVPMLESYTFFLSCLSIILSKSLQGIYEVCVLEEYPDFILVIICVTDPESTVIHCVTFFRMATYCTPLLPS